jgi:hypothetical protein
LTDCFFHSFVNAKQAQRCSIRLHVITFGPPSTTSIPFCSGPPPICPQTAFSRLSCKKSARALPFSHYIALHTFLPAPATSLSESYLEIPAVTNAARIQVVRPLCKKTTAPRSSTVCTTCVSSPKNRTEPVPTNLECGERWGIFFTQREGGCIQL